MRKKITEFNSPTDISLIFLLTLLFAYSNAHALDLMERVNDDIKENNDIVVTSYVGLSFGWSDDLNKNLYWGGGCGHHGFLFKNNGRGCNGPKKYPRKGDFDKELAKRPGRPCWQSKTEETLLKIFDYSLDEYLTYGSDNTTIIRSAMVMSAPYGPGEKSGKIIVIYLGYSNDCYATQDMATHLKTGNLSRRLRKLPDDIKALLLDSYIIGYWGHNVFYGGVNYCKIKNSPINAVITYPRGVFVVGCQSAKYYPQLFLGEGIEPLAFTTTKGSVEAYSAVALYDGIGRGLVKSQINRNMNEAYCIYQNNKRPHDSFITSSEEKIRTLQEPLF